MNEATPAARAATRPTLRGQAPFMSTFAGRRSSPTAFTPAYLGIPRGAVACTSACRSHVLGSSAAVGCHLTWIYTGAVPVVAFAASSSLACSGAATVDRRILWVQALPGVLALAMLWVL
jgi:hypothetical protein